MMSMTLVSKMKLLIKETLIFKRKSDSKEVFQLVSDEDDYWQNNSDTEMDLQSDQEIDIPQLEDESYLSKIITNFYEYLT